LWAVRPGLLGLEARSRLGWCGDGKIDMLEEWFWFYIRKQLQYTDWLRLFVVGVSGDKSIF
jgi:hypothetical protein